MNASRKETGLTLVELMVALVLTLILGAGGYTIFSSTTQGYNVNDSVAQMHQNMLAAMDLIVSDLREAGYGLVSGAGSASPNAIPLFNFDNTGGVGYDSAQEDQLVIFTGTEPIGTIAEDPLGGPPLGCQRSQLLVSYNPSPTALALNDYLVINGEDQAVVTAFDAGGNVTLDRQITHCNAWYPPGSTVSRITTRNYWIDRTDPAVPTLMLRLPTNPNPIPIAQGIEDLQLAFGLDANDNHVIDDVDNDGINGDNDDFVKDLAQMGTIANQYAARLVRVTLVGRTLRLDPSWQANPFCLAPPCSVEDHPLDIPSGYRWRVLTRAVLARNLNTTGM
jgi:type IV pilus assembly protein PilW